ncbi:ABC transporter permease subunit [Meridianimarinicoccus sp. RP-17]
MTGGEAATLAALLALGACLFVLPMGLLFRQALTGPEGASLAPLADALGSRAVRAALVNSLDSAAVSAIAALCIGTALALAVAVSDIRAKGLLVFAILLPMMVPPHVTAIAWTQTTGPTSPLLGVLGIAPAPGSPNPLYSRGGVIALLALQHTPLTFLLVLTGLRVLPREVVDAARVAGAGPGRTLGRVILPLLAPTLLAAGALAFVAALGNFGIPALLGIPGRYTTLPVLIWQRLASFGPGMLPAIAVLSALMAAVALAAVAAQMALMRRAGTRLIGTAQAPLTFALGRARPWAEAALAAYVFAVLVLPLSALTATALVPAFGVPLNVDTVTLDNFREVLVRQQATLRAFGNSTLTAGGAGVALAGLAVLAGYFVTARVRVARRAGGAFATAAELSYAVPGIVLSIAFILAFLRPLPVLGVSLYNTLWIIALAYLAAFAAIALKPVLAAYAQLDPALDDAARVSGAGFGRRMGRIFAPLVAPAAASGAILVFLTAYNEITVSALLWSTGNETIGTTIFNYENGGYTTIAAAMAVVTVAATAVLMGLLDRAGRWLPPGVIPWRM